MIETEIPSEVVREYDAHNRLIRITEIYPVVSSEKFTLTTNRSPLQPRTPQRATLPRSTIRANR